MNLDLIMVIYECPTWLLVTLLMIAMSIANECGFRRGLVDSRRESELSRSVTHTLKGSTLGLVALLLGFSFSATTSRHDIRQRLVLDQANAVGTCYLRADLLPDESRQQIQTVLRAYLKARLAHYNASLLGLEVVQSRLEIDQRLSELWEAVGEARQRDPEAVFQCLIVPAANDVIDLSSTRSWANRNHLPVPVLLLLLTSVVLSSLLLGHSSGQSGSRHVGLWMVSNAVCALVLFIVMDYDRPRQGLIRIDHTPLLQLQASWGEPVTETP